MQTALTATLRGRVSSSPSKIQIATPMMPIVIQPSVPECRWVNSVSREMSPKILVAFARPMSAVRAKMMRPYWNARTAPVLEGMVGPSSGPQYRYWRARESSATTCTLSGSELRVRESFGTGVTSLTPSSCRSRS